MLILTIIFNKFNQFFFCVEIYNRYINCDATVMAASGFWVSSKAIVFNSFPHFFSNMVRPVCVPYFNTQV